jgi:hypothetical protein
MCTTIGGVVACGIRDGASNRGRARARWRQHPRASSASGETEIVPEGELSAWRGGDLRSRTGLLFLSYLGVPSRGWQAT